MELSRSFVVIFLAVVNTYAIMLFFQVSVVAIVDLQLIIIFNIALDTWRGFAIWAGG